MPNFTYKAVDDRGKIVKGDLTVQTHGDLESNLRRRGLELVKVREKSSQSIFANLQTLNIGWITRTELVEFSNNMGIMHRADVPLVDSLLEIKEDQENRYLKGVLESVIERVQGGESLSQSLQQHPRCFPKIYTNIIQIGENTGNLDTVFFELARNYKRIDDLRKNVRKAMIYPSFVICTLLAVAIFFIAKVFPMITDLLSQFDIQELPPLTKGFKTISDIIKGNWEFVFAALLLFVLLITIVRKVKTTRYYINWTEIRFPFLKGFFLNMRISFFSRYLAMLQSAGVDIITSLDLSIPATNNMVIEKLLTRCRNQVIYGHSLSETLKQSRLIPNMVTRMISVGEASGTLPEQLSFVANHYDEILERKISTFLTIMEPVLIIILAGMVLTLIAAIFQPLFSIFGDVFSAYQGM